MSHALTGSGRGNYRGEGHWHARRGLLTALATGIFLEGAPKDPRHLGLQLLTQDWFSGSSDPYVVVKVQGEARSDHIGVRGSGRSVAQEQ